MSRSVLQNGVGLSMLKVGAFGQNFPAGCTVQPKAALKTGGRVGKCCHFLVLLSPNATNLAFSLVGGRRRVITTGPQPRCGRGPAPSAGSGAGWCLALPTSQGAACVPGCSRVPPALRPAPSELPLSTYSPFSACGVKSPSASLLRAHL